MQVEKAHIEATLNALKEECEAEAASAEAEVFEAFVKSENCGSQGGRSHSTSIQQSIKQTEEYVKKPFFFLVTITLTMAAKRLFTLLQHMIKSIMKIRVHSDRTV